MPNLSVHLIPFIEIVAALVAAPVVGLYGWRGLKRRRRALRHRHEDASHLR